MMKVYTVILIKDLEDYAYDRYKPGATINEIVDDLTYQINRYGADFDEIAILDVNDDDPAIYYDVVSKDGKYELVESV